MILVMNPDSTGAHVSQLVEYLAGMGLSAWVAKDSAPKLVEVLGGNGGLCPEVLEAAPMVDRVVPRAGPVLAAGRRPGDRTAEVPLGSKAAIGGRRLAIIAGPCSVESGSQLLEIAAAVKEAGAVALRGGAFKPRTSPYSFQGHGERGLELLALAREETGLAVVTEVMSCSQVELVARYADVLQVGSRSMHDTQLLAAVGRQSKPVLLKRGWSATLEEFLFAAEYVMLQGNKNVIFCERGIRTPETYVRNTLALSIVPEVKRISTLPIIVDPSHGTGRSHLVAPMSYAATACGADGLLIEAHGAPGNAWSDGSQSLDLGQFASLMQGLRRFAGAAGRDL
jgi:3-deoxy-7-phosphoheptulonate synthase